MPSKSSKSNTRSVSRTSSKKKRTRSGVKQWTAKNADPFELYEMAVQTPDAECDFFEKVYKKANGKLPRILREDFCATAAICRDWVTRREDTLAFGVDLSAKPLAWAMKKKIRNLSPEQGGRISLVNTDVLHVEGTVPQADVISAGNFSWWVFTTRELVRQYFSSVRKSLAPGGLFVLDLMGGTRVMDEMEERRRCKGFTYVWEQHSFDPLTSAYRCYIHFDFKTGPRMKRAFRYDWRLWTVAETLELLREAGFANPTVYLEGDAKGGGGNGVFSPARKGENCESFLAYIVA